METSNLSEPETSSEQLVTIEGQSTNSEAVTAPYAQIPDAYSADALLDTVKELGKAHRRRQRLFFIFVGGFLLLALLLGTTRHGWNLLTWFFQMSYVWAGGAALSKRYRQAVSQLAVLNDVRAAGPLAELLGVRARGSSDILPIVTKALINLLPKLRASDASLLNPEQSACLNRALAGRNAELAIAILAAFEQVGDGSSIPAVEKLAGGGGLAARNVRVHETAQRCLPFLRERAAREAASQTLLRAASQPPPAADTLLRPAAEGPIAAPEQLLRARQAPRDEGGQAETAVDAARTAGHGGARAGIPG